MSWYKKVEILNRERRMSFSDFTLVYYYKIILEQCKYNNREDGALIEYINEMEYRNIKYKL